MNRLLLRCAAATLLVAAAAAIPFVPSMPFSGPASVAHAAAPGETALAGVGDLRNQAWTGALGGDLNNALGAIRQMGAAGDSPTLAALREKVAELDAAFTKREAERTEQLAKVSKELDGHLAEEATLPVLSKALQKAIELHMLTLDKPGLLKEDRIVKLMRLADGAAREAEAKGDWMTAAELFGRLNLLLEEEQKYKKDARRVSERLAMIRLYVPERLWELRNERRLAEKLPPLPPFNALGEDFNDKLRGVEADVVLQALAYAAEAHVERVGMREMLLGGLESIRTMITTHDLEKVFPGFANADARRAVLTLVDERTAQVAAMQGQIPLAQAASVLRDLLTVNQQSVQVPSEALLHEFGNGAFGRLDEFSQIVWPDELARFKRMTEGSFVGVGIQIQMDEETQQIKVVTPLDDTPAQRAGIASGDVLKKIDGKSALGLSLDQAVEQITGRSGSSVNLTMERDGADMEYTLQRQRIPLRTVRGWERTGKGEMDWNWFIDPSNKIGYIRVSNFADSTTRDIVTAVTAMRRTGLRGLIFDLRFNPGGLLDQAVEVSNLFIDDGKIVYTQGSRGRPRQTENADAGKARLKDIPTVVLINETSASASEIVSGAVRHYADQGKVQAIVLGNRSYGKGSVQNVMPLSPTTQMKLTMAYYYLPNDRLIHRREGATSWGVEPHLKVDMLPKQISDALILRQDADLPEGAVRVRPKPKPGDDPADDVRNGPAVPSRLIAEGIDLQLHTALVLLQARAIGNTVAGAGNPAAAPQVPPKQPG